LKLQVPEYFFHVCREDPVKYRELHFVYCWLFVKRSCGFVLRHVQN